ncbi:MAG: hypothetical protein ACKOCX_07140 [Planctomycetota bacterium]
MPPCPMPLTEPQSAALAKLACGVTGGEGLALLCGPPGVGKTTVLERLAADLRALGRLVASADVAGLLEPSASPADIVIADDAHLADAADLGRLLARCRTAWSGAVLVLAGEGRLLTLLARDPRLSQATRIRAILLPGSLADTAALLERRAVAGGMRLDERAVAILHEIAGGTPAGVMRLAELADVVASSRPDGQATAADIEAIHRRLAPQAA